MRNCIVPCIVSHVKCATQYSLYCTRKAVISLFDGPVYHSCGDNLDVQYLSDSQHLIAGNTYLED